MSTKPIIVFVPGAWHSPFHYSHLFKYLETAYPIFCAKLPSVSSIRPGSATVSVDAAFIRETMLMPYIEAGHYVVLIMHSYGGMPGMAAATGLSAKERAGRGLKGGIVALATLAGLFAAEGKSLLDGLGGKHLPWVIENDDFCDVRDPGHVLFNDVPEPYLSTAIEGLGRQATVSLSSPLPPVAMTERYYRGGERLYIRCTGDNALPLFVQNMMTENSGQDWTVKDLVGSSHSPFLSRPKELAGLLMDFIQGLHM